MSVTAFCQLVQARWHALTEAVWPPSAEQLAHAEIARLTAELERRYQKLVARSRKIEELRARLAQQATHHVAHARNQRKLAAHEARYAQQRRAYLQRKRLRLALARGEVVVIREDRHPDD